MRNITTKILSYKFPQFLSYLKKYSLLWDDDPDAIHSKTIKKRYKVIHYERLLAYNYFNKISSYINKMITKNQLGHLNIIEVGLAVVFQNIEICRYFF